MRTILMAVMFLVGTALAGTGSATADAPARMELTDDGPILVNLAGVSLYTYAPDTTTPGESRCTNVPTKSYPDPTSGFGHYPLPHADLRKSCADKWPPYLADAQARPSGDFGLIDRTEGGKQWTYRGLPLYTSLKDKKPGDRNGVPAIGTISFGNRGWRLAAYAMQFPPGLRLLRRDDEITLAMANNRPVYTRKNPKQPCHDCDAIFLPLLAPSVATVGGDWSVVKAGAGRRQYAFRGMPLYAAPESLTDWEIADDAEWQRVVFHKTAGLPPGIGKRLTLVGTVYTDKTDMTLYVFACSTPTRDGVSCDDPGDAAQYWTILCGSGAECAKRWRPYVAPADAKPSGEWSVVDVAYPMFTDPTGFTYPPEVPRVKAWAYRGAPVYTYYEDKAPGDIFGNGVRLHSHSGFHAVQVPGLGVND